MTWDQEVSRQISRVRHQPNWFKNSFKAQIAFITSSARLKAAQCTRRAGKSYGAGLYLMREAYENPGISALYIALSRDSAERIMWKDVLKSIDKEFGLKCTFRERDLSVTMPNGSVIYLTGADSREDDMSKFLGQKYKLVIIDEAAKFRIDVEKMIYDVLKPAVADYEGTIALIGTACNFVESFFAKLTAGRSSLSGWEVSRWSALDNPHMRKQFLAEIAQLKEANPRVESEPWFRQNYLGEWVVDEAALVYKYPKSAIIESLPELPFHYHLAAVISYTGHTAIAIVAESRRSRQAFIVEARSMLGNDLYLAVQEIQQMARNYNLSSITIADASKRLVEEVRRRFSLSVQEPPDTDKLALIRLLNTDLGQNNIKVLSGNADLVREWDSIVWDDHRGSKPRESPLSPNHTATAVLYAWQRCYNYTYTPEMTSDDPMDQYWERLSKAKSDPTARDPDEFFLSKP